MMRSPPSTRPRDARGRRSFAFARDDFTQVALLTSKFSHRPDHPFLVVEDLEYTGVRRLRIDLIGGDIGKRSARLVRAGGTLVSIVGRARHGRRRSDVNFVVE